MVSDATRAQIRAADPAQSTWLSANAGSGKTRVLTDRVARLLLAGTQPQRILCLTYTKAAASEMQNRLFARLGKWAMQDEASLRAELAELGVDGEISADLLARARRLFARAIETPGGLKIQTIHSFCASLLRRFPLEAGVSPGFRAMDERAVRLMHQEVIDSLAAGLDVGAVDALAGLTPSDNLAQILVDICQNSDAFGVAMDGPMARQLMGLPADYGWSRLLAEVFQGGEAELMAALIPLLLAGSGNDVKLGEMLAGLDFSAPDVSLLVALEGPFLYGEKANSPFAAKIGDVPKVALQRGAAAGLMPEFDALMARVEAGRVRRLALMAADRTQALHRFAAAFLPLYQARKAREGLLDFDDQISRAALLLSDRSVAAWVLYRLDGGIDHILVDEAQDTSPGQWRVIEALAEEFTAGEGGRAAGRRVFVVGDAKQSIYSFQGADLSTFQQVRDQFQARHGAAEMPFQALELLHSFRSSPAILRTVDLTFSGAIQAGIGGRAEHLAYWGDLPGRVDIWPPVPPADKPAPEAWDNPVDVLPPAHHTVILAEQIAEAIVRMKQDRTQITVKGVVRPIHEGDVLILVQKRSPLFHEIIRACKARGLAIAGADRMVLGAELAVRDLTALLAFLATPEDDLSLAAILRSPLFGWSEGELFDLAHGRPERSFLWTALRGQSDRYKATMAVLKDLRDQADFLRPYELIERMLTRHDGRRRLLARLGIEAEDGIDAFLATALAYEQMGVPSLTGFLVWLASDETKVKRRLDSSTKAIRVMTVHGAKGLESPIVILPDTAKFSPRDKGAFVASPGLPALWKANVAENPPPVADEVARLRARAADEDKRLLYVAMTRAESWLIVAAAGDVGDGSDSWYALMSAAAASAGLTNGRHAHGIWPDAAPGQAGGAAQAVQDLPDWVTGGTERPIVRSLPLSPSGLGGAKALAGEGAGDEGASGEGLARGTALHLLLEHLPGVAAEARPALAQRLVARTAVTDPVSQDAIIAGALDLIARADLGWIWGEDSLAEVALAAPLPAFGGRVMQGVIDRLIVTGGRVTAVDFKSNALVPERPEAVPDGILAQMGAYMLMLEEIYPGRDITVAILWTGTGQLMQLPRNIVMPALNALLSLDEGRVQT